MAMVAPEEPEPLEHARTFALRAGGAESNVAMYLAGLGHRTGWVSRLGDDPLGRRVLSDVAAAGVDTSLVEIDHDAPTGVYFKDPAPGGTRVFYYRRGSAASLMSAKLLEPVLRRPPRVLHVTGITPALSLECDEMMSELIVDFRAKGTVISFDVNFRPGLWGPPVASARLVELARLADVVFVGLDEAQELWGVESPDELPPLLDGPGAIVVKNGAVGATVYFKDGTEFVPSLKVNVREPIGAGDAFAAGWLSGWLRGLPNGQCLRLGHLVASVALGSTADHQALPPWPLLQAALTASDTEWATLVAEGPGWTG